jgi:hypothetical protein
MPSKTAYLKYQKEGRCGVCGKPKEESRRHLSCCYRCMRKSSKLKTKSLRQSKLEFSQRAVDYLGGKCLDCGFTTGYIAAFDFHHLRDKKYALATMFGKHSWSAIVRELDKCVLLCATCHRIRHAKAREEVKKSNIIPVS